MPIVREPQNASSIEKKKKIIEAGLEIITTKGYYNTTTVDIAKKAGVSTGIVYNYFNDKHDILLQALTLYFERTYNPTIEKLSDLKIRDIEESVSEMVTFSINSHKKNLEGHEEMVAMSHLDSDVRKVFLYAENLVTEKIAECLFKNNIILDNMKEKVHIVYNLADNLCHEYFYHRHDYINYDEMIKETINAIVAILTK